MHQTGPQYTDAPAGIAEMRNPMEGALGRLLCLPSNPLLLLIKNTKAGLEYLQPVVKMPISLVPDPFILQRLHNRLASRMLILMIRKAYGCS